MMQAEPATSEMTDTSIEWPFLDCRAPRRPFCGICVEAEDAGKKRLVSKGEVRSRRYATSMEHLERADDEVEQQDEEEELVFPSSIPRLVQHDPSGTGGSEDVVGTPNAACSRRASTATQEGATGGCIAAVGDAASGPGITMATVGAPAPQSDWWQRCYRLRDEMNQECEPPEPPVFGVSMPAEPGAVAKPASQSSPQPPTLVAELPSAPAESGAVAKPTEQAHPSHSNQPGAAAAPQDRLSLPADSRQDAPPLHSSAMSAQGAPGRMLSSKVNASTFLKYAAAVPSAVPRTLATPRSAPESEARRRLPVRDVVGEANGAEPGRELTNEEITAQNEALAAATRSLSLRDQEDDLGEIVKGGHRSGEEEEVGQGVNRSASSTGLGFKAVADFRTSGPNAPTTGTLHLAAPGIGRHPTAPFSQRPTPMRPTGIDCQPRDQEIDPERARVIRILRAKPDYIRMPVYRRQRWL